VELVSFGQLLRQLRTSAGLSQEELARAAELSTRTVSDLERGINHTARNQTALLLAAALSLTGPGREGFLAAARGRDQPAGAVAATRTLPRDIAAFTGRAAELRQLTDVAGTGGIYLIGGMAGVGKTAFAIRAARQLAPVFPDGQIFLPLHSHTPGQHPVQPGAALASLLQTIGITPAQIPPSLPACTSLWRDHTSGQRLLLVLDDAEDSDQVAPLLPAAPGALVLITTRRRLAALDDARLLSLDTLPPEDAASLLARLAARPGLDPADPAIAEIAGLCGRLPLALGMVARQLYHHPAWTPAQLAADLAAARTRLEFMHAEDLSVAAAFGRSYQDLTIGEQHMFRCLGLHPGTDTDAYAAAALAGVPVTEARRDLEGLYDHYLLTETARGRYRFHDLIREHARTLAQASPPAERDAATSRLLDYYLHTARAASHHLTPSASPASPPATEPASARPVTSRDDALAFLDAERVNLHAAAGYAAATGQAAHAAGIPAAMHPFLRRRGHWNQALALHDAAARAARDAGSQLAEARALTDLGDMQFLTDDYAAATTTLTRALEVYRGLGDRAGQAGALTELGAVQHATGDTPAATATLTRALGLYQSLCDRAGQAGALTELGLLQHATGGTLAATATLTRAVALCAEAGSQAGQASALTGLASVHEAAGKHDAAATAQRKALDLYRYLGDRLGEANALTSLGTIQHRAGHDQDAEASHIRALQLYRDLADRSGEAEALNNIADMTRQTAAPATALPYYQQALTIASSIAAQHEQARALEGIGLCHASEGSPGQAGASLGQALAIYQRIGSPRGREVEQALRALPARALLPQARRP
jgi:tetratricopeptide (TPR) repeat protein/transcriptional regulator with XRE-family HTH domain